jgi:hypothetical protein
MGGEAEVGEAVGRDTPFFADLLFCAFFEEPFVILSNIAR